MFLQQAPDVQLTDSHAVLFNLPLPEDNKEFPVPRRSGEDKWDENHVRLPSSPASKYSEIGEDEKVQEKLRWELIRKSLSTSTISNSRELEKVIKSYNTKFATEWKFSLLHELFEDAFLEDDSTFFFQKVMPKIITLALRLPELIQSPIPLLRKKSNTAITLSQEQAGCLLANAFLCTFPRRNMGRKHTDFPEINFNRLFCASGDHVMEKLKCICNYFKVICMDRMPTGVLTFQRRAIDAGSFPIWSESDKLFSSIKVLANSEGNIEDATAMLQVDFANRFLGGGVLGFGCVQEEIRFVINPEMIVGMLFCESMRPEEAILMTGCQQFNNYAGYSRSFTWSGSFEDETPRDEFRRRMIYVVAIDALSFHKPQQQFEEFALLREANKAFTGFYHDPADPSAPVPVASGNWGCGVFRGHKPLKVLIQLMTCCANRRNLVYYTFGEDELMEQIHEMFHFLTTNEVTIGNQFAVCPSRRLVIFWNSFPGQLWKLLIEFKRRKLTNQPDSLYSFIYKALNSTSDDIASPEIEEEVEETETSDKRSFDESGSEMLGVEEESGHEKVLEKSSEDPPTKKAKTDPSEAVQSIEQDETKEEIRETDEEASKPNESSNQAETKTKFKITDFFKPKI